MFVKSSNYYEGHENQCQKIYVERISEIVEKDIGQTFVQPFEMWVRILVAKSAAAAWPTHCSLFTTPQYLLTRQCLFIILYVNHSLCYINTHSYT